ncbi:hypothetical protein DP923_05535 [Pontibacter arcticus]|uniref:Uncharacterized protein n=1 Tax=Pontibacter arcticus TaxID=2080288 RepID=A0A364REK7_9BACT|nr:hypothetical protein DP923_05535 [Pontibacter arcticus]
MYTNSQKDRSRLLNLYFEEENTATIISTLYCKNVIFGKPLGLYFILLSFKYAASNDLYLKFK